MNGGEEPGADDPQPDSDAEGVSSSGDDESVIGPQARGSSGRARSSLADHSDADSDSSRRERIRGLGRRREVAVPGGDASCRMQLLEDGARGRAAKTGEKPRPDGGHIEIRNGHIGIGMSYAIEYLEIRSIFYVLIFEFENDDDGLGEEEY